MCTIVLVAVLVDIGLHVWAMFRNQTVRPSVKHRVAYLTPGREQKTLERAERDEE